MQRSSALILGAALVLLGAGCSHMTYTTLPGELYGEGALAYREVGNFEIEVGEHYFLWGWAKVSDEAVARAVVEKVREMGGNGVRDLHYKVTVTFLDVCLSCIGGIITYQTQTVVVSGTVIQITGGGSGGDVMTLDDLEAVAEGDAPLDLPVTD